MKILFFGRLREMLTCSELEIHDPNIKTLGQLRTLLAARGENWQEFLLKDNALAAINQEMALESDRLSSADEVAFFPPVTGG